MSAKPNHIRKVLISAYGDVSNVSVIQAEISPPAKHEVQVNVLYAGFSGADIRMRRGEYPMQRSAPLTPGYCFIGRVGANGRGASRFKPGDLVTALTIYDSEADKINVEEKHLIPVPDDVDPRQALALTLDWSTAYGLVHRAAKVTRGQRVFVHCISGAVGYAAMILSQMQGAVVYGTASERNHEALRELGAIPFTYTNKDWIEEMKKTGGAHAVFDPLGFDSWDESWDILVRDEPSILVGFGGNLYSLQDSSGKQKSESLAMASLMAKNMCLWTKRSTTFYYIDRDRATFKPDLAELMKMLADNRIWVPIRKIWDLQDVKEAHEAYGKVSGMGSLLIRVTDTTSLP
ncbi:hypothetical protein S40285_03661 [Stachybotrys chlorohalonatus IBT 40285]|jgi:NADPH:quinone reductase-like Zn-dependent oxidoreductase|uniref:Enoyl reductase (ER) domain-containing protein n=1 Tax=Stachybotrys chlorohalonatus (strain IBT 40285) TaxID=1283841 RepID=A0A084QTQ3_STAC4|nr:hypothetical protein S40285_03661 [Stachybotrys chlorohalonata IBT 40285]